MEVEREGGEGMIVTGWKIGQPNNKTGAGYGIRISKKDRDRYFKKSWDSVEIEFEGGDVITVSLSDSFWKDCTELRSSKIGKWMLEKGFAPWQKGKPPKIELIPVGERRFKLIPLR